MTISTEFSSPAAPKQLPRPLPFQGQQLLDRITIRLLADGERPCYTQYMTEHHYLKSDNLVGEQLRYVVEAEGHWVALLSWSAASYHLAHRDQWIGWTTEQRRRRLSLLANNSRFLILPGVDCPNLASKSLGLCLARLSADWRQTYGHPILVVESFVDSQLFRGTSYKAQGWTLLGHTKGFERTQQDYYTEHGRPKQLWVKELAPTEAYQRGPQACETLRSTSLPADLQAVEDKVIPQPTMTCKQMGTLWEMCREIPDWRKRKGRDYNLASIIAMMVLAALCGVVRGQRDLAAFAEKLTQAQLRNLRSYRNPRGTYDAPKESTFQRILAKLDPDAFEKVLLRWEAAQTAAAATTKTPEEKQESHGHEPPQKLDIIAIDGKCQRGSEPEQADEQKPQLVSVYSPTTGSVLATVMVEQKSNEIPATRELLAKLGPLDGRVVMADALNCQHETTRIIVQDKGADYLLPVKDNQKGLLSRVQDEFKALAPHPPLDPLPQRPLTRKEAKEAAKEAAKAQKKAGQQPPTPASGAPKKGIAFPPSGENKNDSREPIRYHRNRRIQPRKVRETHPPHNGQQSRKAMLGRSQKRD